MKQTTSQPKISPYLGLTIGVLAVSTASIFIRYAQEEVSSVVVAAWRWTDLTALTPQTTRLAALLLLLMGSWLILRLPKKGGPS